MPASFEMRGPVVTHDPNLRLDQSFGKLPVFDPTKLAEALLNFFIDHMEEIPILGVVVTALRELLDSNGDGEITKEDLIGLFMGRGVLDALASGNIELGQLFRPTAGQERNWLEPFDTTESLDPGAGWSWDGTVGRTALGSARCGLDGVEHVLHSAAVDVAGGQEIDVLGFVRWSGWAGSGAAFGLKALAYNAGNTLLGSQQIGTVTPSGAASADFETALTGSWTAPAGTAYVRVRMECYASSTAGTVWFDDLALRKPAQSMPQDWITNLIPDLSDLGDGVADAFARASAAIDNIMNGLGHFGTGFSPGALLDALANIPTGSVDGLDGKLSDLFGNFLGLGNALNGFLRGSGTPSTGTPSDPLLDWVRDALGQFTGQTNTTATTADQAHGVGSNALTNTVAIQAQVQGLVARQDQGWSARPLWGSMDYTADATFPKHLMMQPLAHTHAATGITATTNSPGGHAHSYTEGTGGIRQTGTDGGHTHVVTMAGSTASTGSAAAPAVVNSASAFLGYIRCGSVQEKRLFTFLAQASGTVSTFSLDVYRMAADGTLTLAYSSANFAGAITGALGWVQHTIPSGTASVTVAPGDILAVQLRMTGAGSVALGGITTPLPLNPVGWYPLRESAVRNPSTPAPASIAAATANAQHTSTAIPFIEAAIDTGMTTIPISITDNFDGSLNQLWQMGGANGIDISSNNIGIVRSGTDLADGYSWGKFQQQLRTDQAKVGLTVTATSAEEQIVWFKGRDAANHVGLAITSSNATLYTIIGGTRTNRASIAISSSDADYEVRYNAATKVFTVWRNSVQIGSWTDSGNVAPTGLGNRFGGVGLHATRGAWFGIGSTKAAPIDNWLLADI